MDTNFVDTTTFADEVESRITTLAESYALAKGPQEIANASHNITAFLRVVKVDYPDTADLIRDELKKRANAPKRETKHNPEVEDTRQFTYAERVEGYRIDLVRQMEDERSGYLQKANTARLLKGQLSTVLQNVDVEKIVHCAETVLYRLHWKEALARPNTISDFGLNFLIEHLNPNYESGSPYSIVLKEYKRREQKIATDEEIPVIQIHEEEPDERRITMLNNVSKLIRRLNADTQQKATARAAS